VLRKNQSLLQVIEILRSSKIAETYLIESPNIQYGQLYRVSHFNPTWIALTAFLTKFRFISKSYVNYYVFFSLI